MGISDDIKPKHKPNAYPADNQSEKGQASQEAGQIDDEQETVIPIDRTGLQKPVLQDLASNDHLFNHPERSDRFEEEIESSKPEAAPAAPPKRTDDFKAFADYHQPSHRKSHLLTFFIILFVLILAALLIIQNLDQIKKLMGKSPQPVSSDTNSSNASSGVQIITGDQNAAADATAPAASTDQATTPSVASDTPTTSSSNAGSQSTQAQSTVNLSAVKLEVLNGNGVAGTAAKVKDQLTTAGYTVSRVANAAKFTYATTYIYYNTDKKDTASAVQKVLSDRQTTLVESAPISGTYDIVVVVGKS